VTKRIVAVAVAALAIASPARAELATEEKLFVELLVSANFTRSNAVDTIRMSTRRLRWLRQENSDRRCLRRLDRLAAIRNEPIRIR
jgi:hypothetical protein